MQQEYAAVRAGTPCEEGDLRLWAAQNSRQRRLSLCGCLYGSGRVMRKGVLDVVVQQSLR